jgi:2-polyprenyl-3-methyl-5-hydroxy-6-metoxy-1,4-benzoquinol methylase
MTAREETPVDAARPPKRCVVCDETEFRRKRNVERLPLWQCRSCRTIVQWPQPSDERIAALYGKDYYRAWDLERSETEVRKMKIATFRGLIRRSGLATPARTLDVGCATGYFLEAAEMECCEAYGIDVNEWAVGVAQERFGAERVKIATLEAAPWPPESFDGIFMSDLIEHVRSPRETLERAFALLRPGGMLACVTPRVDGFSCKWMGGAWPALKLEHLTYFTPESLERLLRKAGFERIAAQTNRKAMTPNYFRSIFERYPRPFVTPLLQWAWPLLRKAQYATFTLPLGDMECFAHKPG